MNTRNTIFFLFVFLMIFPMAHGQEEGSLEVGNKIPLFSLPDENGNVWSVSNYIGVKTIVVYFYPAAMTGGCTRQACSYRDNHDQLEKEGIIVVGISGDETENLKVFRKAEQLNFTLLSDHDGKVARKFGVPVGDGGSIEREIDGKKIQLERGVTASRWTFIADKDGEIRYINRSANPQSDSQDVLDVIAELDIR